MTINDQIRETSVSKRTCPPRNIGGAAAGPVCARVRIYVSMYMYIRIRVHRKGQGGIYIVDVGGVHRRVDPPRNEGSRG